MARDARVQRRQGGAVAGCRAGHATPRHRPARERRMEAPQGQRRATSSTRADHIPTSTMSFHGLYLVYVPARLVDSVSSKRLHSGLAVTRVDSPRMPRPLTLPKISRARSKVHGFGVFAAEPINKNRRIIDYAGELIPNAESEAREERYLAEGCIWVFRVNGRSAATRRSAATWRGSSTTPVGPTAGLKWPIRQYGFGPRD